MVNSNPDPNPSPSAQASQNQQARFEELSKELAEKELELATLQNELASFETRYARTVGVYFAELDRLDREIARELARLHPEESYQQGYRRAEKKAQTSQEAVDRKLEKEPKTFNPSEELKNLFRKVAKTIHPDLATNEEERAYRTELMARANAAYRDGDAAALEKILYEWEHRDEMKTQAEKQALELDGLDQKIARIQRRLAEIQRKIDEFQKSELHQLMLKVKRAEEQGQDLLSEMAANLQPQIRAAQKYLNHLKQEKGPG